ncbi:MAG: cbb3-type cytochrome c oxidase subunit 3 [Devosia sp.]
METAIYETMRHFADSWGLVYMVGIFIAVLVRISLPGAKQHAIEAARIPLDDDRPAKESDR